jgi:hypothetical protein
VTFASLRSALGLDRLSARDRRAVRLGLMVLVPAVLWVAIVRPYRTSLAELHDRIAAERALLAREEALVADREALPPALAAAEDETMRTELRLVRAQNAPLAEAELTTFLQDVAGLSRVLLQELRGVEPEPAAASSESNGLVPIRLAVRGESDLEGVMTFLHRVETSPLLLRVVELSIEPVLEQPRRARRRSDDDPPPEPLQTGVVAFAIVLQAYAPTDLTGGSPGVLEAES